MENHDYEEDCAITKGTLINVKWPKGKDGPYKVYNVFPETLTIYTDGEVIEIPKKWCEVIETKIEEGRLVKGYYIEDGYKFYIFGKYYIDEPISDLWEIEPVNRRWNELDTKARDRFLRVLKMSTGIWPTQVNEEDFENIFNSAILESTGEASIDGRKF